MNDHAPEGSVFVCFACGKVSRWRYGFVDDGSPRGGVNDASPGWDESCMMHCDLVPEDRITKPWTYPERARGIDAP